MKKLLLLLVVILMSCEQPVKEAQAELDFPYEPTYQKEWKIGSQENVLLVQNLLKSFIDGDIDKGYSYMSDDIEFWHQDGSVTNNLDEFKEIYDEALRSGAFTNHSIGVNTNGYYFGILLMLVGKRPGIKKHLELKMGKLFK